MRECTKKTVLSATTTVSALTSFVCLCIAVSTDHWLYALERLVSDTSVSQNITYKRTETGLWRKCTQIGQLVDFLFHSRPIIIIILSTRIVRLTIW